MNNETLMLLKDLRLDFLILFYLLIFAAENHRRGLYLQMNSDGRVTGNDAQTPYSEYLVETLKTEVEGERFKKGFFFCFQVCFS